MEWPGGVARGLALALRGLGVRREELRESEQRLQRERRRLLSGAAPPRESCRWSAEVLLLLREPASGALQQIRYASEGGDGGGGVYRSRLELSPWISRKRLARRSAGTA
ncbi:hypothetical protein chiPu_0030115, partial [Chiloscyllium punctatum]|nr:hypothetical protein [Chiloscyllium punctatum]